MDPAIRRSFLLVLLLATAHAIAGNVQCEQEGLSDRLACKAQNGLVFLLGGTVVAVESGINTATRGTAVQVQLPDGSRIAGILRHKALEGRKLPKGEPVRLTCNVNEPPFSGSYARCELAYPSLPPEPKAIGYYERTGNQPSYGLSADERGVPDPDLIKLERPLKWVNRIGM